MEWTNEQLIETARVVAKYEGEKAAQLLNELATRFDCALAATRTACAQRDALAAENAGLKSGVVRIFNYGYQHGHESTVEGNYVDIHRNDISEYHEDIVAEIAEEQTPATDSYLAEVRASAIEDAASERWGSGYVFDELNEFAAQLRQGAAL